MKSGGNIRKRMTTKMLSLMIVMSLVGCSGGGNNAQTSDNSAQTVDDTVAAGTAESKNDQEEESASGEIVPELSEESVSPSDESDKQTEETVSEENSADKETEQNLEEDAATTSEADNKEVSTVAYEEEKDDGLTPTMRNSINMLNYMTSLTQSVNEEKGNQMFLEKAYNSFDNLFPNSVDTKTQAQITNLMDTVQGYRMISVKRERIEYIYEKNRAQAFRKAIPNPIGLLSAVSSGDPLKLAASVLYMVVDSASNYEAATSQADLQFLKDGWELDDQEANELHSSTKNALNYMYDMVRDYDIPGDYALSKGAVEDFVTWSGKPDSQLERKISWFETNQRTYAEFGPYWLELAKDYYNNGDYKKCLDAVNRYEKISTRIFRKDIDYANTLPMAIVSAREVLSRDEYVSVANKYCSIIHDNTKDEDWSIRYFTAEIYMDLYAITKDDSYMESAYRLTRENVNVLVDEQRALNASYLADVKEAKAKKGATDREKDDVKKYNKLIKEERKTALPPVSEALYLNSDLLFELAKKMNVDSAEQKRIENILHEKGDSIFLSKALDDRFWFDKVSESLDADQIDVSFEGDKFIIPASCVTDRSTVEVNVSGTDGTTKSGKWSVTDVKRPKGVKDCSVFSVTYEGNKSDKYKFKGGETVTIKVTPVVESPDEFMEFTYNAVAAKKAFVVNDVRFERVKK